MNSYTIDLRVYKLLLKLTPQKRTEFLKDLLKLNDTYIKENNHVS
jgi:hypothetical protein